MVLQCNSYRMTLPGIGACDALQNDSGMEFVQRENRREELQVEEAGGS